ncbi:MAG: DUF4147 domain-containing protein [Patescibacteria group bacterium]|nr:DUF4147 domain-containing protein [Patescibacteria group bacterium]
MKMIKNFSSLASSPLRKQALSLIEAAFQALEVEKVIKERVFLNRERQALAFSSVSGKEVELDLTKIGKIYLIGFGKGSLLAIASLKKTLSSLGEKIAQAIALDKERTLPLSQIRKLKIKFFQGSHPHPSLKNIRAAGFILKTLNQLKKDDLVIYFIGGGGSALLCASQEELRFSRLVFERLTKKGASIKEINTARKHLSLVKGGFLARYTYPATSVSLIVSDVCGNDFSIIASGPTVLDKTTKKDALRILKKYFSSEEIKKFSLASALKETPKNKKYFSKVKNLLLACNQDGILAMKEKAQSLGLKAKIISLTYQNEARKTFLSFLKKIKKGEVFLLAGETTVKIEGKGKGGRNQEAVLGAIAWAYQKKFDFHNLLVASFSSDGWDNTPVAGALADEKTLQLVFQRKINPFLFLKNNDSFHFFKKVGGHLKVRRQSFNVADLMMIIKGK